MTLPGRKKQKTKNKIKTFAGVFILMATSYDAIAVGAGSCKVAATKCEVENMITKASLAPQTSHPLPIATFVALNITSLENFKPAEVYGAQPYSGNASMKLNVQNFTTSPSDTAVTVLCTTSAAEIDYQGYVGNNITVAVNTSLNPSNAGDASYVTLTSGAVASGGTGTDTKALAEAAASAAITLTFTDLAWTFEVKGYYTCVITPATGIYTASTVYVPIT